MDSITDKINEIKKQNSRTAHISGRISAELHKKASKYRGELDVSWTEIIEAGVKLFCEQAERSCRRSHG